MSNMNERLRLAFESLKKQLPPCPPRIGVIPGSGWGKFADILEEKHVVDYASLPSFPRAAFHRGAFTFGRVEGIPVVVAGRLHYYEGHSAEETVMPLRLMKMLGVDRLLMTNAAGGINPAFAAGDFMVVTDHIQLFLPSPLRGENLDAFGGRFPEMNRVYSARLREALFRASRASGVPLKEGVYVQTGGPQFETPAEIRMLKLLGADAVGMSTAVEAVAARHAGMEVAAVSFISNPAAGLAPEPPSEEEVFETAGKAVPSMIALLKAAVKEISTVD